MQPAADAEQRARSFLSSLSDTGRVPNSILIHGPRQSRRFDVALHLVKSVNAQDEDRASSIDRVDDPDLTVIEPDGASVKVAQIREMLSDAYKSPMLGPKRFVVVRGAQKLTYKATQALLKSTEESPDSSCIILLTTSPHDLPKTLESRMIKVGVRQSREEIKQELDADPEKTTMAARMAEGSIGRAKSLAEGTSYGDLDDHLSTIRKKALKLLIATFCDGAYSYLSTVRDIDSDEEIEEIFYTYLSLLLDVVLRLKGSEWLRNPDVEHIYEDIIEKVNPDEPDAEFIEGVLEYWERAERNVAMDRQLNGLLTYVWRWIRGI